MTIYQSPGVYTREANLSNIIQAVSTSSAAVVFASDKGKSNDRVLITNTRQFIEEFGEPDSRKSYGHYAALAYLNEGNNLYCTRVHHNALHAGVIFNRQGSASKTGSVGLGESNPDSFNFDGHTNAAFAVYAVNEGEWGKELRVRVSDVDDEDENRKTFTLTVYQVENGNDVEKERWKVSRQNVKDESGNTLEMEAKINGNSKYIRVKNAAFSVSTLPVHSATQTLGTGNAGEATFAGNLIEPTNNKLPIQPFSLRIAYASREVQTVNYGSATSGSFKLGFDGSTTGDLPLSGVQEVDLTGGPTSGDFTLKYGGTSAAHTSNAINHDATAAQVKTAITGSGGITAITANDIEVTGSAGDWTINFLKVGLNTEEFTFDSNLSGGSTPSVSITRKISAQYIDERLTAIRTEGVEVTGTGTTTDPWTVIFNTSGGGASVNLAEMTAVAGTLGTSVPVTIATSVEGGSGQVRVRDDGNGKIIGDNIAGAGSSGTINYTTGVLNVTFSSPPGDGLQVNATYSFETKAELTGTGADGNVDLDGADATDSDIVAGWKFYENSEEVDVRMLIHAGGGTKTQDVDATVAKEMVAIAESRKDCIAILDVPGGKQDPGQAVEWKRTDLGVNTSYAALYAPDVEIYDSYNDKALFVPPSGYVAAVYAKTDGQQDVWYAPAGIRRGTLNVRKLRHNYTQGQQDFLYPQGVNFIKNIPGVGQAVWGQRTLLSGDNKLNRVNVRRLLITLEKSIAASLRQSVFELNTESLRLQVRESIRSFMQRVQDGNGVYSFRVVVDETNNTTEVVDAGELHVDVYLQPSAAAEFVQLQAVITRTGASFDELIRSGGNF